MEKEEIDKGKEASGSADVKAPFMSRMRGMFKEQYPDRNFDDDSEFETEFESHYDGMNKSIEGYKKANEELANKFSGDPKLSAMFSDIFSGESPIVAMIRHYGEDVKGAIDDPAIAEKIKAEAKSFNDKVAQDKAIMEEQSKNWEKSIAEIEAFKADSDKSDEEMEELIGKIIELHTNGIMGIITKEDLAGYDKMINYDRDIQEAEQTGEIKGRNEQIDESKLKKFENEAPATGMGSGGGGGVGMGSQNPTLSGLDRMTSKKSLRDRGVSTDGNKRRF